MNMIKGGLSALAAEVGFSDTNIDNQFQVWVEIKDFGHRGLSPAWGVIGLLWSGNDTQVVTEI